VLDKEAIDFEQRWMRGVLLSKQTCWKNLVCMWLSNEYN